MEKHKQYPVRCSGIAGPSIATKEAINQPVHPSSYNLNRATQHRASDRSRSRNHRSRSPKCALRQRIFKYYHRSADFLSLLENQQRRKYDIQSRLNDLIRELQLRNHELTREAALVKAVPLMQAEDQELTWINAQLPQNVQRARDFKAEAKELLGELAK